MVIFMTSYFINTKFDVRRWGWEHSRYNWNSNHGYRCDWCDCCCCCHWTTDKLLRRNTNVWKFSNKFLNKSSEFFQYLIKTVFLVQNQGFERVFWKNIEFFCDFFLKTLASLKKIFVETPNILLATPLVPLFLVLVLIWRRKIIFQKKKFKTPKGPFLRSCTLYDIIKSTIFITLGLIHRWARMSFTTFCGGLPPYCLIWFWKWSQRCR